MAKTKFEEMFDRLPSNIKETEILRLPTKKVLAALLELLLHSEARESRVIYAPNARLRKLSGISSNDLLPSIEQLIDYDLITRKVGKVRKEGEKGEASEYTINIKKLKEPLVEKTFDDLFSEFLDDEESQEMPINTAITTTTSITTSNSIENTNTTSTANSISSSNNNFFEEFKADVDKNLVGYTDSELIFKREEIFRRLNSKRLQITNTDFNRCSSYLRRMFEEALESIAEISTASTDEDFSFLD